MVLIDWDQVAYPYLDELTPTLDAVIQRAKNQAVTMTMCDGEVIYKDGTFTKVDKTAALKALHDDLTKALADDEVERRKLVEGAAAACAEILRELHRHLEAPAVLPAELDGLGRSRSISSCRTGPAENRETRRSRSVSARCQRF